MNHAEAIRLLTEAGFIVPDSPAIASKRLMGMNYPPDADDREIFQAHREWGERLAAQTPTCSIPGPRKMNRLRIGYVSPDLCDHAVAYFAEAILTPMADLDEGVVVFSDVEKPDATTARLRALCPIWHETRALDHRGLAELVERERIDILVDLAGHTADNRLPMFAMRPAMTQMTYLGYPNTTGLPRSVMQYRITDAICDPPGMTEALHTEELLRLPGVFLCYTPSADAPPVAPAPCIRNGYVTFGCFSNAAKLSWETLAQWAELLRNVPGAKLLLKNHGLMDKSICESIRVFFRSRGIEPARLILRRGTASVADHLAAYADVDIALDTFPYNGTTTICEALWMGVPLVTISGQSHRSRVGRSILTAVGLSELAADDGQSFSKTVVDLARDYRRRRSFRTELRETMRGSHLIRADRFRSALHHAFRCAASARGGEFSEPAVV